MIKVSFQRGNTLHFYTFRVLPASWYLRRASHPRCQAMETPRNRLVGNVSAHELILPANCEIVLGAQTANPLRPTKNADVWTRNVVNGRTTYSLTSLLVMVWRSRQQLDFSFSFTVLQRSFASLCRSTLLKTIRFVLVCNMRVSWVCLVAIFVWCWWHFIELRFWNGSFTVERCLQNHNLSVWACRFFHANWWRRFEVQIWTGRHQTDGQLWPKIHTLLWQG